MQEKVIRGHWSDLWTHTGTPKALKCLETDNICHISWYNEAILRVYFFVKRVYDIYLMSCRLVHETEGRVD